MMDLKKLKGYFNGAVSVTCVLNANVRDLSKDRASGKAGNDGTECTRVNRSLLG
jgi:hypothetical protein